MSKPINSAKLTRDLKAAKSVGNQLSSHVEFKNEEIKKLNLEIDRLRELVHFLETTIKNKP